MKILFNKKNSKKNKLSWDLFLWWLEWLCHKKKMGAQNLQRVFIILKVYKKSIFFSSSLNDDWRTCPCGTMVE